MTARRLAATRPSWWSRETELWVLWVLFLGVHAFYGWVASWHPSVPFNDVTGVYRGWVESAIASGSFPGVHEPFVYPVGALAPMLLINLIGPGDAYGLAWMIIVIVLDCVALWWLTMRQQDNASGALRRAAAWYAEGIKVDVHGVEQSLQDARSLLSQQRYEDSIRLSGEAAEGARLAYAEATAEAERRRARRLADLRPYQVNDE
jgi:hypothetical protein